MSHLCEDIFKTLNLEILLYKDEIEEETKSSQDKLRWKCRSHALLVLSVYSR